MQKQRGLLVIVSGFSGAGKGTVVSQLCSEYENYAVSVSATTRDPRPGEEDGVHYYFRTTEEFEEMIRRDAFLEHACYVGNYYGTPAGPVEEQRSAGKDVILEIEYQGAVQVKEKHPDATTVFITPPSAEELVRRLTGRGTEDTDVIRKRLDRAREESVHMHEYDYILVNDDLDLCVRQLHELICRQHDRTANRTDFIREIRKELRGLEI